MSDQLFIYPPLSKVNLPRPSVNESLAMVYGLHIVAPLAHVDGTVLSRLIGGEGNKGIRLVGEGRPQFFTKWL